MGEEFIDIIHYDTGENQAIAIKRGHSYVPVTKRRHGDKTVYRIKLSDLERA